MTQRLLDEDDPIPPLATNLRRDLERMIVQARKTAERGARSALGALTVPDVKAGSHLDAAGKGVRNRLRAHARQLGDKRSAKGEQAIDRLVRECAYEHWHRMLFARFLAENDLLIEPDSGVSVSLDEVEELAREQKVNRWELASRYAQRMLPEIFRPDDPVLAVALPTETRLELESLLEKLSPTVFTADDSLGWVYQFWQSAEKDAVNDRVKSGEKITGETLPAVTQLFTEHYMVLFLLHNTIGAWHAGRVLAARSELATTATSEQELRDAMRLSPQGGYDFEYLRFVRESQNGDEDDNSSGPWRPAAGVFGGWPKTAAEITVLDPCCGSGHFIVAVFELLVRLRMEEEGLTLDDAISAVIADNLFGLELDARCTQIAAFNLALAAWKMAGGVIDLPAMHIACCGIGPQATKEEWLKLADDASEAWEGIPDHARHTIRNGLLDLHETFSQAPELGSLINPNDRSSDLITADYETLKPFLDAVFKAETGDDEQRERAVAAKDMADAAEILVGPDEGFSLVATNPPFLGTYQQSASLVNYCDQIAPHARKQLALVFLCRSLLHSAQGCSIAFVLPQNWLFLKTYQGFRDFALRNTTWCVAARLGAKSFSTPMWDFNVMLVIASRQKPSDGSTFAGYDVSGFGNVVHKSAHLISDRCAFVHQLDQTKNLHSAIVFDQSSPGRPLRETCSALSGCSAGDRAWFVRNFWEVPDSGSAWEFHQTTPDYTDHFRGREEIILWEEERGQMFVLAESVKHLNHSVQNWRKGKPNWGKRGVVLSLMAKLPASLYDGERYASKCTAIVPHDQSDDEFIAALWAFCRSSEFESEVRKLNQKLAVEVKTLLEVPFDLDRWKQDASGDSPVGVPEPQSDDPRQWLFHGHPAHAEPQAVLQVAVARLLDYRWPAELDHEMRLAPESRASIERCTELQDLADEDGIVCLSPLRGEGSAVDRLRRLLAAAFGEAWSANKEHELLQAAADEFNKGKVCASLDEWLRDHFFMEHCALFHHRPFIWHIWDGKKDGFHALVNYHKLAGPEGEGRRTLDALTYSYLGDWVRRQQDGVKTDEPGAEARLAAAMELREQLEMILTGEPPYDLFVRWKPLHEQAFGWEPDINDGVRLNIRPFLSATLSKGRKGAGVLRWKPNIKWNKDRGKEPQSLRPCEDFPWFWGWDEKTKDFTGVAKYDGNRWNDLHHTNDFKQAARERAAEEVAT